MEDYTKDIENIQNEILDQYVNDDNPRPWIIAFSGGKDTVEEHRKHGGNVNVDVAFSD